MAARRTMRSSRMPMGNQQATSVRLAASISLLISSRPLFRAHSLSSCRIHHTPPYIHMTLGQGADLATLMMLSTVGRGSLTGGKEVRREEASQSASMKSRVAPKVVWRRRGDEGGDSRPSPAFTTPDWPPGSSTHGNRLRCKARLLSSAMAGRSKQCRALRKHDLQMTGTNLSLRAVCPGSNLWQAICAMLACPNSEEEGLSVPT